jgi:D-3-phosphoglycerate dehydrogenase / 2-oxoglutarate reductase
VLALVNAALTPEASDLLARERSWEVRRVPSVRSAVDELPADGRLRVRALIVEAEPVDAALLASLPGLELVACLRSDPVNIDVPAATERGVAVVNAPGRNAEAVADFTLGLCIAAVRNIAIAHHGIVSGQLTSQESPKGVNRADGDVIWRPDDLTVPIPYVVFKGHQLSSLILGVVGFGNVGRAVARRFAGLVRDIYVFDPAVLTDSVRREGFLPAPSLEDLLSTADLVTIHARSRDVVIGRAELSMMKPSSYLINTARASVLDYDALVDALRSGHLKGAALDVFPDEPLQASSPLVGVRGLTLTPHLAGAAIEVTDRQSEILLDALRRIYTRETDWGGVPVCNPVLRARWYSRRSEVAAAADGHEPGAGATGSPNEKGQAVRS